MAVGEVGGHCKNQGILKLIFCVNQEEADLAEDRIVDGETYECVKSICYLGDTLHGDGGVDLAATARMITGWMKFRELLTFLTSRAPPLEMKG